MTAPSLRRAVAAEFQRLDAHQFGYDHGFCADPDADPETAAFVDAAIRIVLNEAAALVDSLLGENEHLARDWNWWDSATIPGSIAALLREHAAPQPDTTKEQ